jgi:hypothetical protein
VICGRIEDVDTPRVGLHIYAMRLFVLERYLPTLDLLIARCKASSSIGMGKVVQIANGDWRLNGATIGRYLSSEESFAPSDPQFMDDILLPQPLPQHHFFSKMLRFSRLCRSGRFSPSRREQFITCVAP